MEDKQVQLSFSQKLDYEKILTNPILDIAARFWDTERYDGFKTLYKVMRLIDDLVDNQKSRGNIPEAEKQKIIETINNEIKAINNRSQSNPIQKELSKYLEKFKITKQPWVNFSKAMIYDINYTGFKSLDNFFEYAEGAAVAPASIFLHLCGLTKKNEEYIAPEFDTEKAARPLAFFCYLVHIIRDFQKDQKDNLNYFSDDLIRKNGLDLSTLKKIASNGEINPGFRSLMKEYYLLADEYRIKSRKILDEISIYLEPQYQFSLEIIYGLYLQIFERIDVANGTFSNEELNPLPGEIKERINKIIFSFESNKKLVS